MAKLNAKIDEKVFGLNSKLDTNLNSLSKTNKSGPTPTEREAQIEQLISFQLKHTIEEVKQKYDASLNHYLDTITKMLKVHDNLICATNYSSNRPTFSMKNRSSVWRKRSRKKDEMNLVIQQVLIKILRASLNIMYSES